TASASGAVTTSWPALRSIGATRAPDTANPRGPAVRAGGAWRWTSRQPEPAVWRTNDQLMRTTLVSSARSGRGRAEVTRAILVAAGRFRQEGWPLAADLMAAGHAGTDETRRSGAEMHDRRPSSGSTGGHGG